MTSEAMPSLMTRRAAGVATVNTRLHRPRVCLPLCGPIFLAFSLSCMVVMISLFLYFSSRGGKKEEIVHN